MNRATQFQELTGKIKDPRVFDVAVKCLLLIPENFWTIPASSSGKYHPSLSLGTGGLYRHTLYAMEIALELFRMDEFSSFSEIKKDIILLSIYLHDTCKQGNGVDGIGFTTKTHAEDAAKYYWKNCETKGLKEKAILLLACFYMMSHMGQWSTNWFLKPKTKVQKFIHLCDYIASRKSFERFK